MTEEERKEPETKAPDMDAFAKQEDGSLEFQTEEFKENEEHPDKVRERMTADLRERTKALQNEMISPDEMLAKLVESLAQVTEFSTKVDEVLKNVDRTMRNLKES